MQHNDHIRSFKKIMELQQNQNLLIKTLPVYGADPIKGWKYYTDEFLDKRINRKKYKRTENSIWNKVGKFIVKFDFNTKEFVVKELSDPEKKSYHFTTPHSASLVPKYGKMSPYGKESYNEGEYPINVGVLLNLEKCQFKPVHVYMKDAATSSYQSRFWREPDVFNSHQDALDHANRLNKYKFEKDGKIALYNTKNPTTIEALRRATNQDQPYGYNELLVGENEEAIEGIYAAFNPDNKVHEINYANKLLAMIQKLQFKKQLKIEVPITIMTTNVGFHLYLNSEIESDIKLLMNDDELRDKVLNELFKGMIKFTSDESKKYIEKVHLAYMRAFHNSPESNNKDEQKISPSGQR